MLKPKICTTIGKLMIGDYFVPEGEDEIYDYGGYDAEWGLWIGINVESGQMRLFDDMACVWFPYLDPKDIEKFWNHREEFISRLKRA